MKILKYFPIFVAIVLIIFIIYMIVQQIKENYQQSDPMLDRLREKIAPLFEQTYNSGVLKGLDRKDILNHIKLYRGEKSYTINKEKIFLCLKDEHNDYYDMNMLVYVLLHEISHVFCTNIGHTQEFHDIFEAILKKATELGIYDPTLEIRNDYCTFNDGK
uniref:Uncharacterized protein n=1 Tax=viral metagenome TaxID=1070528 RepID=A0A6C0D1H5_9ZZZZ